ncbi:MAG: hypothetical protein GKR93_17950 [Gammaproteobacteria bacterium]|nr:hypothetical protein [Gammaproteobacteria bacterium]
MINLNSSQHAALSLVILLVMLMLIYLLIFHPALTRRHAILERYDSVLFQHYKLGDVNKTAERLSDELKRLRKQKINDSGFLTTKTESLAAADLQEHIKTLVKNSNSSLISTQVIQHKEIDTFPRVAIKVHMRGNMDALRNVMYQLNGDTPMLVIDNIQVQKRHGSSTNRTGRGTELLDIKLNVSGFMYKAESS